MSAGVFLGGTQRRVCFGSTTVFSIPASNTGRRVSSRASPRTPSQEFSRIASRIPPAILQQAMLHFEALLNATLPTLLTIFTGCQVLHPGFIIASFDRAYSLHLLQHPYPAIPPPFLPLVHRLEVFLRRKIIAKLASLASVPQSLAPLPVPLPTAATPHSTPFAGCCHHLATPASHTTHSNCKCLPLFPQLWLSFYGPLLLCYYQSIATSKSGKKWLACLTYKIWHIPWV
jgi:hypothetical protein